MLNTPRPNRRSSMLRCANPACNLQKSSYLDIVEEKILWAINELSIQLKNTSQETKVNNIPVKIKAIDKKQKELNELKNQKNTLHDLLEKKIYDIDTFLERQNILVDKISKVEKEIKGLQQEIKQEESQQKNISSLLPSVIKVLDAYRQTDNVQKKNLLLKSILYKVTYLRKKEWKDQEQFEIHLYPKI